MRIIQLADQGIDISNWLIDEEFGIYPEGKRDKMLLHCPSPAPYEFLEQEHRYLFKQSSHRAPEQFWVEIFAYQLGEIMEINVPPAFVAYDSKNGLYGALIRWFLKPYKLSPNEISESGGDICQRLIPDFDRKKGKQHNFETISLFFETRLDDKVIFKDWKNYWAKTFLFDALIGNTDRHQDNWAIIISTEGIRIAPVFDNGTSMGYEIPSKKLEAYNNQACIEKYISKGWHHIKWNRNDTCSIKHIELLKRFVSKYPETRQVMINCVKRANYEIFSDILNCLTKFDISIRLTDERAAFMLKLINTRHQKIITELEK